MAKRKTVEDLSFKATDDGELELDGFEEGDEFEDPFEEEEEDKETDDEEEEEGEEEDFDEEFDEEEEEKPSKSRSATDKRLDKLEGLMEKMLLAMATGDKPSAKKAVEEEDEEEEEEVPEELDNKTLVKLLSKRIEKTIDKKMNQEMSKHTPALEQANLNSQFQRYAAQLGQKFVDNIPAVAKIMLKGDIRDVGKAWEIFQAMNPSGKRSNKVSAERTVKKIRRREVDADSRTSVGEMRQLYPRSPFKQLKGSDADVFDKAFNSALIDATRQGRRRR